MWSFNPQILDTHKTWAKYRHLGFKMIFFPQERKTNEVVSGNTQVPTPTGDDSSIGAGSGRNDGLDGPSPACPWHQQALGAIPASVSDTDAWA